MVGRTFSEFQVCPVGIVVGKHGLGIGNLNVGVIDADGRCDENEVDLLTLGWRNAAEIVP